MTWLYTLIFTGLMFSSQGNAVKRIQPLLQATPPPVAEPVRMESERFEQSYPLNADGKVCVSNISGSIVVEAWDRNDVRLEYTKSAESKEILAAINVRVESRPESLKIEVDMDDWNNTKVAGRRGIKMEVNYHLMVPRGASLNSIETVNGTINVSNFTNLTKVSAVNGTVNAVNLRGTADLSTVNGELIADFEHLDANSKIALSTVNGKVKLFIPSDSSATINADSLNGSIANDWNLPIKRGKYVGSDLFGKIGGGDARIKLDSVGGPLMISHRNDGKSLSPSTNLLPQKDKDDKDWDSENQIESLKIDKEIAKAVKTSQKMSAAAMADAQRAMAQMPAAIVKGTTDSIVNSINQNAVIVNGAELKQKMKDTRTRQRDMMGRVADATFISGVPRIEQKTGSVVVTGVPKITINAGECSVYIRGWDRSEIQYRATRYAEPMLPATALILTEDHTTSVVNIRVNEPDTTHRRGRFFGGSPNTRIEVYVPRKSNLTVNAGGEIRLEGVSGDMDISGLDESIDIRDVDGKLQVSSSDGFVRVIGFQGDATADTSDGAVSLEGDFAKLKVRTHSGDITLTLPDKVSAEIEATSPDINADGIGLERLGGNEKVSRFRIGKGGKIFQLESEGEIRVRGAGTLKDTN